ncbi:MAG: right-handed parallel beta-helix repeat-containing protein [Polyangiales bacterium]
MSWNLPTSTIFTLSLGVLLLAGFGCGGEPVQQGLAVDVSFAPGVPRAARDEAVRVEVYLLESCDSITIGDRPGDALASTYVMREGSEGPLIDIPEFGDYGLYALAQNSDCAVVGAACQPVSIEGGNPGLLPVELGSFAGHPCFANQQCSLETGDCSGPSGECVDIDDDGLGDGSLGNVGCVDTTTDSDDGDATSCADTDGDGCEDCVNGSFNPFDDGVDGDGDGVCDLSDDCTDSDGDGLGDGTLGNVGCVDTLTDSDDGDATSCADTDGDGCDDCAVDVFDPSNDGEDADADGVCVASDCNDSKPNCADDCTDVDADGYCVDQDCDDAVADCTSDCVTNTDNDSHVDCFETFCGSDPNVSASFCREVSSQTEYVSAINASDSRPGHDYIVLNDLTITSDPPSFDDDAGVTIRQVAGSSVRVNSGGDRVVFRLKGGNSLLDGVHVVNVLNARDIVESTGNNNIIQNCVFEGFERRGIYVDGGDNAQISDNIITGGTDSQAGETAAIILRSSIGSVISGNTIALNSMDGMQIRQASGVLIDHNTIADNGGSGLEFYGDDSSDACLRNNNVTGNGDFGYHGDKVVTFDTSATCTAPLAAGPAYGNNSFGNDGGSCGGDDCLACACLPTGSFWEYSVDPLYTSTAVGDSNLYCLGSSSVLIDGGSDLLDYDVNGDGPGDFNGSAPDIGSREDGPGDCN